MPVMSDPSLVMYVQEFRLLCQDFIYCQMALDAQNVEDARYGLCDVTSRTIPTFFFGSTDVG